MDFEFVDHNYELVRIKTEIEIIGFHSIYYLEFDKNFYHTPESHNFWELIYVDSGRMVAVTNGIGTTVNRGHALFHRPAEPHAHISNKEEPHSVLVISFSCDDKNEIMNFFDKKIFRLEKNSMEILSLFLSEVKSALGEAPGSYEKRSMITGLNNARLGSLQLLQCYLVEFLLLLMRNGEDSIRPIVRSESSKRIAKNSLIEAIKSYLEDNIDLTFSLDDICEKFSVGKSYLCKNFREATGESPINYFIKAKAEKAKRLIVEGDYNITQIAEKLGYKSVSHFTRTFTKVTKLSPLAYKQSIKR